MYMKDFIDNPVSVKDWDPTKGDFFSKRVMEDDQLFLRRKKRKKILIGFLTFIHVAFLILMLLFY